MFMDSLQSNFYEKMFRSRLSGFNDLVTIGERMKQGLNIFKIPGIVGESSGIKKFFGNFHKKKKGETNPIFNGEGRSRQGKPLPPLVYQQSVMHIPYYAAPYVVDVASTYHQAPIASALSASVCCSDISAT